MLCYRANANPNPSYSVYSIAFKFLTTNPSLSLVDNVLSLFWLKCDYKTLLMVLTLAGKALNVEVAGLDTQHLSFAWFPTSEALDEPLPCWWTRVAFILSL